ncbi:MAG: hypothetical protein M3069_27115 [Chloroflexota bacterium]|nr:hypothetical protein [Chloroflexota bacterium]
MHTTTTTTTERTRAIDRFLDTIRGEHDGPSAWAQGAVLDAVVPGWRFSVSGDERIRRQLRAWFHDPGTIEELRRLPILTGEVVELTITWIENGVPHAARQVHVLELEPDGRIGHDNMWCGGRWSATLLAEMEAARDAD